ncbi:MAG: hypothetical protein ACTSQE_11840, partial [Candidatus Heimdallarchaeaceae archaeon]
MNIIPIEKFSKHSNSLASAAFSDDGKYLATGGWDNTIRIWDIESGDLKRTLLGHDGAVVSIKFSSNDQEIVSAGLDNTIRIFSIEEKKLLQTFTDENIGRFNCIAISIEGLVAAGSSTTMELMAKNRTCNDNIVRVWDRKTGTLLHRLKEHMFGVTSLCYSSDGKYLASAGERREINVWNTINGTLFKKLKIPGRTITNVKFSSDSTKLFVSQEDQTISSYSIETGELLDKKENQIVLTSKKFFLNRSMNRVIAISPDSSKYLSVSKENDRTAEIYHIGKNTLFRRIEGQIGWVAKTEITSDAKVLVANLGNLIKVWNVEQGVLLHTLQEHDDKIEALALSRDGKYAVSGGRGKAVLWDIEKGEKLFDIPYSQPVSVEAVAISPDGKKAAISNRWTLVLWDIENKTKELIYENSATISCLKFSNDGKLL